MSVRHGYHDGFIEVKPIILTIEHHLGLEHEQWEEDDPRLAPLSGMWEMSDLRKQLGIRQNGGKKVWVDFNLADAILCKLRLQNLWRTELLDIYERVCLETPASRAGRIVPKGHRMCARQGCTNTFPLSTGEGKGSNQTRKRYCSKTCNATARKHRRGSVSQLRRRLDQCPNGHDRSPENVYEYTIKSGPKAGTRVRRCRLCFNAAQQAYRAERKAA